MPLTFALQPIQPSQSGCSLWINLAVFPIPFSQDITEVGLTWDQLKFAGRAVLEEAIPNTATTLFFPTISVRVNTHIPQSFTQVRTKEYPYIVTLRHEEWRMDHRIVTPSPPMRSYEALTPEAVLTAMSHQHTHGERVTIWRTRDMKWSYANYRHRDGTLDSYIRRLDQLYTLSQTIRPDHPLRKTALIISNSTPRELFLSHS